jgi:hypothetical protein
MTQPKHRPERDTCIVHVGSVAEPATLPEWWGAIDSDVESRQLRFGSDGSTWVPEDELPASLTEAGCRLATVAETEGRAGLADPALALGQPVVLRPEPHPSDSNAIAVWTANQQHIGYVLGEVAAETMSESHRRQAAYKAVVAGEQRDRESGERSAVTVLLGPGSVWVEATSQPS